jgi:polyhydroxyalkanoate synthesis regulator protein
MRSQVTGAVGAAPGIGFLEDQVRQNLVLFNRAMKMFSPFNFTPQPGDVPAAEPAPAEAAPAKPATDTSLDDLKQRIEEMQAQIARLAAKE